MIRTIRVFEHEKLTLYKDDLGRCLSLSELDKLYKYNDEHNNRYFTGIRDGIKFKSWVGVIQIGKLTLEILPKTDRQKTSSEQEFVPWQRALLKMLAVCDLVKVEAVSQALLARRMNSILDLYFEIFLSEVSGLLKSGLIKKYRKVEGNAASLKGRLVFSKNIRKNLVHQERSYTVHETYDHEHLLNQIIIRALRVLKSISTNIYFKDRINRILLDFPEMKEIEISELHFRKLKPNRKSKPYEQALRISRMIILNYSPDVRGGSENMLALMFDMNRLWEEYIFRMLRKNLSTEWQIKYQNSQLFWEDKRVRPDLVLRRLFQGREEIFIIDTKWKIIDARNPSDDDLKQMYVYNMYWNSTRSVLLYPSSNPVQEEQHGNFHKGRTGSNQCKLGFINVLDDNGNLDADVGLKVIDKLL